MKSDGLDNFRLFSANGVLTMKTGKRKLLDEIRACAGIGSMRFLVSDFSLKSLKSGEWLKKVEL